MYTSIIMYTSFVNKSQSKRDVNVTKNIVDVNKWSTKVKRMQCKGNRSMVNKSQT